MLEDVRRQISHRREAKEKERLRALEKERRLSYLRMKRLQEHKAAEEELKAQAGQELSARETAKRAHEERRLMEKELRRSRGPGVGIRTLGTVGKATKAVLYDFPVKSVRLGAKLGKSGRLQRIIIGDTSFVLGVPKSPGVPTPTKPSVSIDEFIFGASSARKPPTKGKGLFDIDKDILK